MKSIRNTVRLIGNVGTDPEIRTLTTGKVVARFPLATSEMYTNKDGEKVFDTQWHNIVAWGNTAKLVEKICKKGLKMAVDGKITTRSYDDKDGNKKYITEIVANELITLNATASSSS